MPDDKKPIKEFAAAIKAKYPQYADMNDTLLTKKIVERYPEYADMVDMSTIEPVKKKEPSGASSTTTSTDGQTGLPYFNLSEDQLKQHEQRQKNMNRALGIEESGDVGISDDPIKHVLNPVREKAKETYKNLKLLGGQGRQPSESTNQGVARSNDFGFQLQKEHNQSTDHLQSLTDKVYNTVFPNGKKAEEYLRGVIQKNNGKLPEGNETANVALEKASQYEGLKKRIEEKGDLTQLAVDLFRQSDDHLDKQISLLEKEKGLNGKEGKGLNIYDNIIPGAMQGRLVDELIHHPDIDVIASENPGLKSQIDKLRNGGLYDRYPDYATSLIANEISRAREREGGNNWFANPIFNNSKYLDNLADRLYKDDPVKKKFVDEHFKGHWEGKIDTPGFVDEFGTGAKDAYKGMFGSLKDVSGFGLNYAERTEETLKKAYEHVSSNPKGLHKVLGTSGNFLGMIGAMATGGIPLRAAGMSPAMANRVMLGTTFYDNELNEWTDKYPGEPWKAQLGAITSTGAFMALPDIAPSSKVAESIQGKMREEISSTLKNLEEGAVDKAALSNDLVNKFKDVLKETTKGSLKGASEMAAVTTYKTGLDQALGLSEKDQEKYHPSEEIPDVAKSMLIGGALPHFLSAYGNRNAVADGIYSIASNPDRFKSVLGLNNDPLIDKKISDIDFLSQTKKELDARGIAEPQQKRYLLEALQEKNTKERMGRVSDANLIRPHEESIRGNQEVKSRILNGEEVEPIPYDEPFRKESNIVKEFFDNDLIPKQDEMMLVDENGNFKPEVTDQYLKYISDQAQGVDAEGKPLEGGAREKDMLAQGYPQELIDAAKEAFPVKQEAHAEIPVSEPVSETMEGITEGHEPTKASEESEPTLTVDEGAGEPPKGPTEIASEPSEGNKVGVSHKSLTNLAKEIGLPEPQRGVVLTPKEYADRGRMLIEAGARPYDIANEFKETGKISPDMISVARAHLEDLAKTLNQIGDKFGDKSPEYKDALSKYQEWRDDIVKPMGTRAGETFTSLQGERDIDTGSFTALKRLAEENLGKELNPKQVKEAKELADKVATLSKEVDSLKEQLAEALNKNEKGEGKTIKEKAKNLAKKLREQAKLSRPGSFSVATPASLVWDGAVEIVAKSIEAGGELAQAISEGIDFIKKSDWYKGLKKEDQDNAEKEFTDWHTSQIENTPEAKNIRRLEKELENLQSGIVKNKAEKREPAEREKELKDQIFEEKKKLGLIKSKEESPEEKQRQKQEAVQKLAEKFSDKKDNKFTNEEAAEIWDHAKHYLDTVDFDQMIANTSMDLGLTKEQVRDALTTPKGTKKITDEMYTKQSRRNAAIQQAKDWANASKVHPLVKFLKTIPRFFFAAKVFGHGTVGMVTHAGVNVYDPKEWRRYWPIFFKQFKFAYGKEADYEKAMQDLKHDEQFTFWKRAGLAVDPTERYDEYQFVTKAFNKLGNVGRWLTAGDRGFNALKVYRIERAKSLWNELSDVEKAHPQTPKEIAKLVNHSTGTTGLKVSDVASMVFFAPNLELARWNKLIVDPAKAVKTFTSWKEATPAEKAAAKIVAKRAGRILATYVGALAVNQGLLSLSGSNQKINFTNPTQSDWLKFKTGGRTIDLTGGMVSLLGFLMKLGHTAIASSNDIKNKSRKDELMNQTYSYVSGKFSPFASTAKDVVTHHDFQGNTLPFYDDKPLHSWNRKLTLKEYLLAQQTPIPIAEAYTDIQKQMEDAGVPKPTVWHILEGILVGGIVGGTGAHIGEEPEKKHSSFTDEDKSDPTFKYFIDKGLELPNTSPTSESIKDKKSKTIKKLSDYPEDIQKKYNDTHKEFLKDRLKKVVSRGYVYINDYGQVSINPPNEHHTKKRLDDLNKEELADVLHEAQSFATERTKKQIF